jgi:hypothetical protein
VLLRSSAPTARNPLPASGRPAVHRRGATPQLCPAIAWRGPDTSLGSSRVALLVSAQEGQPFRSKGLHQLRVGLLPWRSLVVHSSIGLLGDEPILLSGCGDSPREVAMESSDELRQRAERYRRMALFSVTDGQAIEALKELAVECDALATTLEAAGRPPGMED